MLQKFQNGYDKRNGKKRSGLPMMLAVLMIASAALTACAPRETAEKTEFTKAAAESTQKVENGETLVIPVKDIWRSLLSRLRMARSGQHLTPARYAMIQEEDTISRMEMFLCARTAETVFL